MRHIYGWLWCLIAAGIVFVPCWSGADITPMGYKSPPSGGGASPKSAHPSIRMESEEVIIRLKPSSYTVDAVFHMLNTGDTTTEWIGFPKRGAGTPPSFDGVRDFIRFETWVDGRKTPFAEEREISALSYFLKGLSSLPPEGGPPRGYTNDFRWMVGNLNFPGHAKTTIRVGYEAHYESSRDSYYAIYIYGTGRYWKDSIGKAVFVIDSTEKGCASRVDARFSEADTKKHSIRRKVISENLVRYEVSDLEPVPDGALSIVITGRRGDKDDRELLFNAALNGRLKEVQSLLIKGIDANTKSEFGDTALMSAAWGGHLEVAKLLLEKGADVNAETKSGQNALYKAMENAWTNSGQIQVAQLLRENGAKPTTLATAAFVGDVETTQRLIEEGADLNQTTKPDDQTMLMAAAMGGHSQTVKLLLDKGLKINATDKRGKTALIMAANGGHAEVVQLLLDRGADINSKDSHRRCALNHAVWLGRGYVEVVKVLLDRGAEINARDDPANRTILMHAAQGGHLDVVKLLLEKSADVNAKDNGGKTALSLAQGKDIEEIEKVLTAHGARR